MGTIKPISRIGDAAHKEELQRLWLAWTDEAMPVMLNRRFTMLCRLLIRIGLRNNGLF